MPKRLAYLVGAKLAAQIGQDRACTPRPEYAAFTERNGCTLLDLEFADRRGAAARGFHKRGMPHVGLAAAAAAVHRDYDAYLVSGEDVGLPLALFTRLRGIGNPIFIITHGSYFRSPKFRWLMRLIRTFKNVHFLCLAESLRSALQERFGVPADRAHNTGYGVDISFFKPRDKPAGGALIASAGTATRDYRTLVQAAEGLPAEVRIAADSAWFPSAVDITGDTLPPNVKARSYGDYCGLRELYASATCVVVPLYPSRHACGFAVTIEAMAMGKAVIATRTEACSDFIIEGETGIYVPPGDVSALRNAIRNLLDDPARAREMGCAARRLIEERFSLEAYCERIERLVGSGRS